MALPLRIFNPTPNGPKLKLRATVAVAVAVAAGGGVKILIKQQQQQQQQFTLGAFDFLPWASLSLTLPDHAAAPPAVESRTGTTFPKSIHIEDHDDDADDGTGTGTTSACSLELAGTGLRKKNILGVKSIVVYAFGVYANAMRLREERVQIQQLADMASLDAEMSVRLVIVYGSLKIRAVRSAFEDSIGGRIKKFNQGVEDKQLLHSFTNLFKDDIKLPKGTAIDMVRLPGHVLCTKINGEEVGRVRSQLLCKCVFDLYIGEQAFDEAARDAIAAGIATMLSQ